MSIYQIPAKKKGYILQYYADMNRAVVTGAADIQLIAKPFGEVFQVKHHRGIINAGNSQVSHRFVTPIEFVEKTIIKTRAVASANNTDISAGFELLLIDN